MKICPVCKATLFDDMAICYSCMYRFGSNPDLERRIEEEHIRAQIGESPLLERGISSNEQLLDQMPSSPFQVEERNIQAVPGGACNMGAEPRDANTGLRSVSSVGLSPMSAKEDQADTGEDRQERTGEDRQGRAGEDVAGTPAQECCTGGDRQERTGGDVQVLEEEGYGEVSAESSGRWILRLELRDGSQPDRTWSIRLG